MNEPETTCSTFSTNRKPLTMDELKRIASKMEEFLAQNQSFWTLISPDGKVYRSERPRDLVLVLARDTLDISTFSGPNV